VPRPLERAVLRCLAKDPAERFASAQELIVALDAASASEPRRWLPAALGVGAVLAMALLAWQLGRAAPAADASVAPSAAISLELTRPRPPATPTPSSPTPSAIPPAVSAPPVPSVRTPAGKIVPTRAPLAAKSVSPSPKRDPLNEQK